MLVPILVAMAVVYAVSRLIYWFVIDREVPGGWSAGLESANLSHPTLGSGPWTTSRRRVRLPAAAGCNEKCASSTIHIAEGRSWFARFDIGALLPTRSFAPNETHRWLVDGTAQALEDPTRLTASSLPMRFCRTASCHGPI